MARPYRETVRAPSERENAFLCFQRRTDEDLIVSGYKILGSAQRRVKGCLLQHGSLLLGASAHAAELPGILQLASISIAPERLATSVAAEIERTLGILSLTSARPTEDERRRAASIQSIAISKRHPGGFAGTASPILNQSCGGDRGR